MASVSNKRKKNSRLRGSSSHGWGAKKKHRGAGHRGGRGNAGSGKRGDAKKPSFWKFRQGKTKIGFVSRSQIKIKPISILQLNLMTKGLAESGIAVKQDDKYVIELIKLKKNKLLSNGKPAYKYDITAMFSSAKAVKKIEAAGGKVTVLKKKKEKKAKAKEE